MAASFVRFHADGKNPVPSHLPRNQDVNHMEMDRLHLGDLSGYLGPTKPAVTIGPSRDQDRAGHTSGDASAAPFRAPSELEISGLTYSRHLEATTAIQTWNRPAMNRWRLLSACLVYFANGMNDSAPGALLPYIEQYYKVDYAVVSTIFISNAVGFILAAFFVHALDSRFGRARTLMFCEACVIAGYVMMTIPPPFPVFVLG